MFFFFLSNCKSNYLAVDLGTGFIKSTTYQIGFDIVNHLNSNNKLLIPSAVAFKNVDKNLTKHLDYVEAAHATLLIGDPAIKYLKHNPKSGSSHVPYFVGRHTTKNIEVPAIVNSSYMLTFLLKDLISTVENFEGLVVTIPAYYTFDQRAAIIDSLWTAHVPFLGLVDDYQSMVYFYSSQFSDRYIDEPHSVTFVDIGETSCKAYNAIFDVHPLDNNKTNTDSTIFEPFQEDEDYDFIPTVNITSYEFSENCGSNVFVNKISESLNISLSKARKRFNAGEDFSEVLTPEIETLKSIVRKANNGCFSEVQLLGGASRLSYIVEAIREAAGESEVKKELPAQQSLSIGAMIWLQEQLNLTKKFGDEPTEILPPTPNISSSVSIYNTYIQCNNKTQTYCVKGGECNDTVLLEDVVCDRLYIKASDIPPEGCSNFLSIYDLKNISKLKGSNQSGIGFVQLHPPFPVIISVLWCKNQDMNCDFINHQQYETPLEEIMKAEAFVHSTLVGKENQEIKTKLKADLINLVDSLSSRDQNDPMIEKAEYVIANQNASILDINVLIDAVKIRLKYPY